jgi:hypothetical protein
MMNSSIYSSQKRKWIKDWKANLLKSPNLWKVRLGRLEIGPNRILSSSMPSCKIISLLKHSLKKQIASNRAKSTKWTIWGINSTSPLINTKICCVSIARCTMITRIWSELYKSIKTPSRMNNLIKISEAIESFMISWPKINTHCSCHLLGRLIMKLNPLLKV